MTARPEGCGVVPVASNQRDMDSRIYSPAQCVGQLAENAAAKGADFNATEFNVTIMSQFETSTRTPGTDVGMHCHSQALNVLDNGKGFVYEEVEDMLTYGTPQSVTTEKKFGRNNHGLKAVAATLSPACCLLFSKARRPDGEVWHTLAAIGSNFDSDGFYNLRRLSWPSSFTGDTMEDLAAENFFQRGSTEAFHELFSAGGKNWATMKTLNIAHKYFREIKETGVLGIFPFGLRGNDIQAVVSKDDIKMQGVSLSELLAKYFLHPRLRLLPESYWKDFRGFEIKLHISNRQTKVLHPHLPPFSMSPPLSVTIGAAEHTVVYGPYQSEKYNSPFPYKPTAGTELYNQNYQTYLASRSRIMNPLYAPKTSDSGNTRIDYFAKQKTSQKNAGSLMSQLLDTLCGVSLDIGEAPEAYAELRELLDEHQIFDAKNPHLKIEEYVKQLKNLKWLLGLPFEIYAKVDTDSLQFNDAKDDLKDDALKRDSFFANVHATIALDVLKRMLTGFKGVVKEAEQKAKAEAKAATPATGKAVPDAGKTPASTGKKGQLTAATGSAKSKGTPSAKRVPKAAQQPDETATEQAADPTVDLGRALAKAASAAATAVTPDTAAKEVQQEQAAQSREHRYRARQGATATQPHTVQQPQQQRGRGQNPAQQQGQGQEQDGQLADLQAPKGGPQGIPPWEMVPAAQGGPKRRKLSPGVATPGLMESLANGGDLSSADAQGLNMLAKAAAAGNSSSQATSQSQQTTSQQTRSQQANQHPTLTLDSGVVPDSSDPFHDADSAGPSRRVSRQEFEGLWQRAVAHGQIKDTDWTQDLKMMALLWAPDSL